MMEVKNVIIRDSEGDFDYEAEGIEIEIVEVFEDGIEWRITGENETFIADLIEIDGNDAIVERMDAK